MATILITGGTGMIGTALTKALLQKGHAIIILTRPKDEKPSAPPAGVTYAIWDIEKQTIDPAAIGKADHIIHLAGAGIADKRWSEKRKKLIRDSRVHSGELLVKAMQQHPNNIKTVVGASAIGWYGPDPVIPNPKPFVETDPPYNDFLGQTCKEWEAALHPATALGKRLVTIRTGIVVSPKGGAIDEFKKPLRFGVATILGSGKQMISWIHLDDLVQLYVKAVEDTSMTGIYNGVSPYPVSNKELVIALAKARGKFYIPVPVPSFALKIALGEMSIEVLKSATVSDAKLLQTNFTFKYPSIAEAAASAWTQ